MKKIVLILALTSLFISCGKDKAEVKTIDDIQKQKGVPVKVKVIKKTNLTKWEEYNGTLRGSSEVNVVPSLGDRLEKIFVKVGDYVKKDQIIAKYEKDNVQAKNNQAKIAYENSKLLFERMQKVYKSGSISKQDFDNITAKYEVDKQNYYSSNKVLNIKAPISGYITDIYIDDNRKILDPKKNAICRISNTKKMKIKVFIDEDIVKYIKKGDKVKILWDAYKDIIFKGKITTVSLSSTEKARGFAVEIEVNNSDNKLKSGIFVNVLFKTLNKNNIISISKQAIRVDDNLQKFVFVSNGKTAKKQIVKTGKDNGIDIEILSGLNVGDNLITEGIKFLKDGLKIKVIK